MVCEGITKDPAIQPGECARAIDTFRTYYIAQDDLNQAENALREHQKTLDDKFDFFGEFALLIAYLSGYAPQMPLYTANEIATKLVKERRNMK